MAAPYWTNRLARPEDTQAVLDLVAEVYPDRPHLSGDYWQWRYLNDMGYRAETILAGHQDRAIGVQPLAIFDFLWKETPIKGAMYTGVLTHPDHRRRGVFRSVIEHANERAAQVGAHFSMTLPNDASLPGFLRFGEWVYPGLIPVYFKLVDGPATLRPRLGPAAALIGRIPRPLFRRRGNPPRHADLHCAPATRAPGELDGVFEAFARDCGALMICRTAAYWNWRYTAKPSADYRTLVARQRERVAGVVVTAVREELGLQVGMVVDIVCRGGVPVLRHLLHAAEEELRSRGVGFVACQATSTMLQCALREEGYRRPNPRWLPKHFHFVYRMTHVPGLPREPSRLSDWHLTFGDSDNV